MIRTGAEPRVFVAKTAAPPPLYITRLPSPCITTRVPPLPPVLLDHVGPLGPYTTRLPSPCMTSAKRPSADVSRWPTESCSLALSRSDPAPACAGAVRPRAAARAATPTTRRRRARRSTFGDGANVVPPDVIDVLLRKCRQGGVSSCRGPGRS